MRRRAFFLAPPAARKEAIGQLPPFRGCKKHLHLFVKTWPFTFIGIILLGSGIMASWKGGISEECLGSITNKGCVDTDLTSANISTETIQHEAETIDNSPGALVSKITPTLRTEHAASVNQEEGNKATYPLADLEIVVGHCHEDISYLDDFKNCQGIHVHIFSPCGGKVPHFNNIKECVSIHQDVKDCGRETYSYFDFIVKRYGTLPDKVVFLQGGGSQENPELVMDISERTKFSNLTYSGLGRIVRDAWHMKNNDTKKLSLQDRLTPGLQAQSTWVTAWRSQFIASKKAIQRHPISAYIDLNKAICEHMCVAVQCNLETWLGPLFGCAPYLFRGRECQTKIINQTLPVTNVTSEGVKKAGKEGTGDVASYTKQTTCGNKGSIYVSEAWNNGLLLCTE